MNLLKPAVALVVLVGLLAAALYAANSSREPQVLPGPPPTASQATTSSAPMYSKYVGYWCDSVNATSPTMSEEGMSEIEVTSASTDSIAFTVMHTGAAPSYRITSSDTTITATIVDGVATFEFRDDRGGRNSGIVQFLDEKLVVEILSTGSDTDAIGNGSIEMNCLMLKDQYRGTREVLEPEFVRQFIGVVGDYSRASVPDEVPTIRIISVSGGHVTLDLTGTCNDTVYYRNLNGRVIGASEVEVRIDGTGVTLLLHWENPGTIRVERLTGDLSGALLQLLESPTYWNSAYLHTS